MLVGYPKRASAGGLNLNSWWCEPQEHSSIAIALHSWTNIKQFNQNIMD